MCAKTSAVLSLVTLQVVVFGGYVGSYGKMDVDKSTEIFWFSNMTWLEICKRSSCRDFS